MRERRRLPSRGRSQFLSRIKRFDRGSGSNLSQTQTNTRFAESVLNMLQVKEGVWRTRPGSGTYGVAIPGIDKVEAACQYVPASGNREIVAICKEGSYSYAYKSTDDAVTWSKISNSITFTPGKYYQFVQFQGNLYIVNGTEKFTFYNGTDLVRYTLIASPSGTPTLALTTLTSGSNTNYYAVLAVNTVGKTTIGTEGSVTTNKHRDYWSGTENAKVTYSAVSGAEGYMIFWGETTGDLRYIGSSTTTEFVDYGQTVSPVNDAIEPPLSNDTDGPVFKRLELSGNRLWGLGIDNLVYWAGVGQYYGSFSPFYGGGWTEVGKGTEYTPVDIVHYRSGKGDPILTVLCGSPNGNGITYQVDLQSTVVGSTSITYPLVYQIVGSNGSNCPQGNMKVGDDVLIPNKKGVYALRNKQQMFNVLSTDNIIQAIRDRWNAMNSSQMDKVYSYFSDPYGYITFATGSSEENDTTIVYNKEIENWSSYWTLGFRAMFEYTDNTSQQNTKVLLVPNDSTALLELSENFKSSDAGTAFTQYYVTPVIKISEEDYTLKGKPKQAITEVGDFQGTFTYSFLAETQSQPITTLKSKTVSAIDTLFEVLDDPYSDFMYSDSNTTTSQIVKPTRKVKLNLGKKIYTYQHKIFSNDGDSVFEILGFQVKGSNQPARAPSGWS